MNGSMNGSRGDLSEILQRGPKLDLNFCNAIALKES